MDVLQKIRKRDGTLWLFQKEKIEKAVLKAFEAVDGEITDYARTKATNIAEYIYEQAQVADHFFDVEEIQDMVEKGLMSTKRKDVARAYITYREERNKVRHANSKFFKTFQEKISAANVQNQNANVDEKSFGGRIGEASSATMKQYALDYYISQKAKENHLRNRVYIHDLDHWIVGDHNCLSVPFDKLLANGFKTRQTDVRPANSVNTAMQLVAVIFQLQSLCQFGGVSATHLDWTMVPYVRKSFIKHWKDGLTYLEGVKFRMGASAIAYEAFVQSLPQSIEKTGILYYNIKDYVDKIIIYDDDGGEISYPTYFPIEDTRFAKCIYKEYPKAYKYAIDMTEREIYQSVEGLYHNLNTLQSRSGNQLPFTSINYGTCTLPEGRMITKALLDVSIEGLGKNHITSVFPCGIFQCMKGVNRKPGDPNYDLFKLALRSTAQRLYPNYANVDWSGNAGYDPKDPTTYFSTMGCRTANGWDINGLKQKKDGRGNICPVTIILPTIAMEAKSQLNQMPAYKVLDDDHPTKKKGATELFMRILDDTIQDAHNVLLERFEWICSQPMESARFMYENGLMEGYVPEEGIRSALKHGTLALGQLGLAEALEILIGCNHTKPEGMELAKRIEQLFKDRCAEFKEQEKLNFGVYYTPAENLCYTAMQKFKATYGEIPKVSDKEFFTNSIHVPVWEEIGIFDKISIEAELTGYSSAGCITYIELDSGAKNNLEALETIVNFAMDKDIPYFAINVPNDACQDCGYTDEIGEACPQCGCTDIRRLRRVTGYLTGSYKEAFNLGKQQEVEMRYQHSKKENFNG